MKTKAAVLTGLHQPFEILELDLDGPKEGEVLIRNVAAGLCHSDLHLPSGDLPSRLPIIGGHEGAGVVEEVGPGVTKVKPGDHVVCSFIPSCGTCRSCSTGHQNLCDLGEFLLDGQLVDGTFRFHHNGEDVGGMCSVGTFSQYSTVSQYSVVKIDESIPLETAVLTSCGVPTGWGTVVNTGNVRPGDTVVIYGAGGLGMNSVQAAVFAGAKYVVVVDPVEFKRDTALKFGATHVFADPAEAQEKLTELTHGQLADQALILTGVPDEATIQAAFGIIGKGGTVVLTGIGNMEELNVHVSGAELTLWQKTIKGSLFGSCNPQYDIAKLLGLYQTGQLKLDELITRRYRLDEVNQGYQDLVDGKNIRGVIIHEH